MWTALVFPLLCGTLPLLTASQRAWGISLRGGFNSDGSSPTVVFGPNSADATSLSSNLHSTALEVKRRGEAVATFGSEIARLPETISTGEVAAGMDFAIQGVPQWTLWDLDTFDTPDSAMWMPNDRSFCSSPEDHLLGGHCHFGATMTQRQYSLPTHTRVRVRARVHFIDKWEGESVSLLANGKPMWSESHEWCPAFLKWMCEKYGVDTCGRSTPDRLSVKAEAVFAHSGPSLDIAFNSSLPVGTDPCYQSWGVDDVSIELM
jgi:hypothetical protein